MNGEHPQQILLNVDEWQRVQRPRELMRFAPVIPLSTACGCLVIALYRPRPPGRLRGSRRAWDSRSRNGGRSA
jgi:hypothetical protein